MNVASPDSRVIASATLLPRSALRPVTATFAPSLANRRAVAAPIPEVPPVTSATRFLSLINKLPRFSGTTIGQILGDRPGTGKMDVVAKTARQPRSHAGA